MEKLVVVGIFFDGYYDLWEDYLECFELFWPDCPYKKYIINNTCELKYEKVYNVEVLHAGEDAEYSRKVQTAIELIDAEYYLLLLEDFFIGEKISKDPFEEILQFMGDEDIEYYSMPLNEFQTNKRRKKIGQKPYLRRILPQAEYTISCQPAIWKRDFLKKCIGKENFNAWVFEGIYTRSIRAHSGKFLQKTCEDHRNLLHMYHGALQGKIIPDTYEHFINKGYKLKNKREKISCYQYRIHKDKAKLKELIPVFLQKKIKTIKKSNSVIERYQQEIDEIMGKMGIE